MPAVLHPKPHSRQHVRMHGKMDLITFIHINKIDIGEQLWTVRLNVRIKTIKI